MRGERGACGPSGIVRRAFWSWAAGTVPQTRTRAPQACPAPDRERAIGSPAIRRFSIPSRRETHHRAIRFLEVLQQLYEVFPAMMAGFSLSPCCGNSTPRAGFTERYPVRPPFRGCSRAALTRSELSATRTAAGTCPPPTAGSPAGRCHRVASRATWSVARRQRPDPDVPPLDA